MRKYRCATTEEIERARELHAVRRGKVDDTESEERRLVEKITRVLCEDLPPAETLSLIRTLLSM